MIIWQADHGFDLSGYQDAPCRNPETLRERVKNPNGVCTGTVSPTDGFQDILLKLRELTIDFKKPVVLVHGDSHYFMVDKPLLDAHGRLVENFTRVETFGDNTFKTCPRPAPVRRQPRALGEGTHRPPEPRRFRLPGADRASEPNRRPRALTDPSVTGFPSRRTRESRLSSGSSSRTCSGGVPPLVAAFPSGDGPLALRQA